MAERHWRKFSPVENRSLRTFSRSTTRSNHTYPISEGRFKSNLPQSTVYETLSENQMTTSARDTNANRNEITNWRKIISVTEQNSDDTQGDLGALDEIVKECAVCGKSKTILKLLPCLHSMCQRCLTEVTTHHSSRSWIKCHLCQRRIEIPSAGVSGFEDNSYFKFSDQSITDNERCDLCKSKTPSCKCSECKTMLCNDCVKDHLRNNTGSKHYIVNVHQEMIGQAHWEAICKEHSPFTQELYCLNCTEPICGRCSIGKHNNHVVEDITMTAKEKKNDLINTVSDGSMMRLTKSVDDNVRISKKVRQFVETESNTLVEEIQRHIQSLKDELDEFGDKIIKEIREHERDFVANSNRQIEDAEKKRKAIYISSETAKQIADRTREIDFINKYPSLKAVLTDMKRSNKPAPLYCSRMKFIPLVNTLRAVGRIETESFLTRPLEYMEMVTIHLNKHISSICPVDESKAWVGFRKYIQLCCKDGTVGQRIDLGEAVMSIAENTNGAIFVACKTSVKVIKSNLLPKFLFQLSHEPSDMKFNHLDQIIISFKDAKRVALFTTKGKALHEFDIRNFGFRFGTRINEPWKIGISEKNDVYLSDFASETIAVFDKVCEIKSSFMTTVFRHASIWCSRGLVFVADYKRDNIQVYSEDGHYLQTCDTEGIIAPCCLAVDKAGDLWAGAWSGFIKVYGQRS